jgi:hypothetical protein
MCQESEFVMGMRYETQDLPFSLQPDIFQLEEAEALKIPEDYVRGLTRFQLHCLLLQAFCRKVGAQAHPSKVPPPLMPLDAPVLGARERHEIVRQIQNSRGGKLERWNTMLDIGIQPEYLEQMELSDAIEQFQERARQLLLGSLGLLRMASSDEQEEWEELSLIEVEDAITNSYAGWEAAYMDRMEEKKGSLASIEIDPQNDIPHLAVLNIPSKRKTASKNSVSLVNGSNIQFLKKP